MAATTPSDKPRPTQPDTSQDFCSVCGTYSAPFILRDRSAGTATRFCRTHVPAEWASIGIHKSLTRLLEELFIERFVKSKEPAVVAAGSE